MSVNARTQPSVFVVVLVGGVSGLHPVPIHQLICESLGHKSWLADLSWMSSFVLK